MSDAKHTPGPWERDGQKHGALTEYVEAKGFRVAAIYAVDISNDAEVEANARLIAAAPDLLKALKAMLGIGPPSVHTDFAEMEKAGVLALVAIAKAEGREP